MHAIILSSLAYLREQKAEPSLEQFEGLFGKTRLRTALIKLFSWLNGGARYPRPLEPLSISIEYPWCRDLAEILRSDPEFQALFMVNDLQIEFHSAVSQNERQKLCAFVDANFRPPLMRK